MWWQDQLSSTVVEASGGRRVMALHEGPQRHMVEEGGDIEGVVEARDAGGATKMRQWCVVVERSRPQGNVVAERDCNRGVVAGKHGRNGRLEEKRSPSAARPICGWHGLMVAAVSGHLVALASGQPDKATHSRM